MANWNKESEYLWENSHSYHELFNILKYYNQESKDSSQNQETK